MKMLKAAIIGLGNIGFRFNLDPLRKDVWSHAAAYDACRKTELCGAVEVDHEKAAQFIRYYRSRVPVFSSIKEIMKHTCPDIVSICTPTNTHYTVLKELVHYPVKGIFCEKPVAQTVGDARKMLALCDKAGVKLGVNHSRRWQSSYLRAADIIRKRRIGNVKAVHAIYSGQIFNIGTHLFDAIRMMIQKNAIAASGIFKNGAAIDPGISGWIEFEDNILCTVGTINKLEDLIFEIDIIGDKGRIRVLENGAKIELYIFNKSRRYSGYRELLPMLIYNPKSNDRLTDAIGGMCAAISRNNIRINCSGEDGLEALKISTSMLASAKNNGKAMRVGGMLTLVETL